MLAEVKKCADSNDIKGLHYIFVDCLDVDPTFEKYSADFEYCKSINGFLVSHINITPVKNKENWDKLYWEQLKLDLMKNFSEKRFTHMRDVAKIIYADKVYRLQQEREKNITKETVVLDDIKKIETLHNNDIQVQGRNEIIANETVKLIKKDSASVISVADKQQRALLEKQKALELYNQQIAIKQREQQDRIEAARQANVVRQSNALNNNTSKKIWGVVIALLAVIAIIVVVVLIKVL